jgi:hypothetical protein
MKLQALAVLFAGALAICPAQQRIDGAYTAKIREFTTEPHFLTELIDHLPASDKVPSPDKVIGYVVGTPDKLTYSKDIYAYLRALESATPRVKVFTMGKTEEGRDMVLAVVSDEANIAKLARLREITAKLADPRKTGDAEARTLIDEGVAMYWATGSIHSNETGSPEMLMELAYRLAVDESPFIQQIRKNTIVMITPLLEVDGHDKMVDLYRLRKVSPEKAPPSLVYWGKYVAHDNNRDGMAMSLALSRHMMRTFLEWHPQVLHDLHESIPFLYTSTGLGPYNAWLDPIVINEWQSLAYHEVGEMTKRGVPGVWTHGFYDGWAANYMFYVANGHNSIGRFYETFGGRGADTVEREVPASATTRTWFRPNPPLAKVKWSHRNNINLQQSAILLAMNKVASEKSRFLENFYLKSKRSVAKAASEGPVAWIIPGDDPRPVECAELVNLLRLQGVEVHRLNTEFDKYPSGSYVIRMDQPYSRMADMLLDQQYYNPTDTRPYDDTGWSLGPLRNVKTVRVIDAALLKVDMTMLTAPAKVEGRLAGPESGTVYAIRHNTDNTLATLRFRLRDIEMLAAEEPFELGGIQFRAGSFLIPRADRERLRKAASEHGLTIHALSEMPKVATHPLRAPRVALVHTWINTQNEGWFRLALDGLQIPYDYISDQRLRQTPDLRSRYDVILFGPINNSAQRIVSGLPLRGGPLAWKASPETPNFATSPDQTDDVRGGMGLEGLANLRRFVEQGGLFVTIGGNASIPIDYGLVEGVTIQQTRELQVRGSVLNATMADRKSPITYGYPDVLAVYFNQAPVLNVNPFGGLGAVPSTDTPTRPTGRGSATDADIPQGRPFVAPPPPRAASAPPVVPEFLEPFKSLLPSPEERPRVVLKFAAEKNLLVAGMLAGGKELADKPAVVDVPVGKGHIVMFAINPMWRQQTQGSFFLLFNAILNFDSLGVGAGPEVN